jgi:hypothetical protein
MQQTKTNPTKTNPTKTNPTKTNPTFLLDLDMDSELKPFTDDESKSGSDTGTNTDSDTDSDTDTDTDTDSESKKTSIMTQITTKSIKAIYYEYLESDQLFLRPEYQRDLCWSLEKMNAFVDTIIKGWIVPNYVIYELSKKEMKNVKHKCECIDGQHRLTTLKYYMESIPLNDNKYIYWSDNGYRVFYNMEKTIMDNIKKRRKYFLYNSL